jgi:hypothetical protein
MLVVGLLVGRSELGRRNTNASFISNFRDDFPLKQIRDQTFKNQTVQVDGNEFINCTFDNVVFKFEGQAPFRFVTDHFESGSKLGVASDNRPIQAAIELTAAIIRVGSGTQNAAPAK